MTNDGGRPNEPTSYGLRPPQAPPAQPPLPAQGSHGTQGGFGPHGAQGPYDPTQAVHGGAPGGQGTGPAGHGAASAPVVPRAQPDPRHGPPAGRPGPAAPSGRLPQDGGGRLVGERYQLLSRLGHGGMGTVWRARDLVVEREVAIKEPRLPESLGEPQRQTAYQRMQREARAAARINHPCVVTMHDVVVEEGKPWVVMELVQGHSLADRLQEGTLDPREVARIGAAVVGALQAAHDAGVLHRDVKPDNVLLGPGGRVVLTDFGIAQVEGEQGLTETGAFVGSPEFVSPERVLGQRPGPASDVWSLGVVLYAAVEGMSPYRRSHTPATLQAVLSAEPQTPARAAGPLATVIMQSLRKDPMARPSAAEVRQTLDSVANPVFHPTRVHVPDAAPGNRWVPPVLRSSRSARWGLASGLVLVVLALALVLLNPFESAGELPEGWQNRPEREAVKATLAVPEEYVRTPDDSGHGVTFHDPSNVFRVYLQQVDNAELDPGYEQVIQPTGTAWEKYWNDGGEDGTEVKDQKVSSRRTSYRGHTAYDVTVDYVDYSDSDENPYRLYHHQLVVPKGENSKVYWMLDVYMPAEGWAHPVGEQLFRDTVRHLEIDFGEA